MRRSSRADLTETRPTKAAMLVARRIVRDISEQHARPGTMLGTEQYMLRRYVTGRGTLREALRYLEFQGVVTLKSGPRGGPIFLDPSENHLAGTLRVLVQLKHTPLSDVFEARSAIEPIACALAASRLGDADLERLGLIVGSPSTPGRCHTTAEDDRAFHLCIVKASNTVLKMLFDSLMDMLDSTGVPSIACAESRLTVAGAHGAIYNALVDRDTLRAHDLMLDHVRESRQAADAAHPGLLSKTAS